ncbi:MAG: single-stranded-DNA-specific exonuclease RecJ [Cytophagales bacterium]|nr:single-stranded-DNA-specific exonuclease RecJ [Cytophagales bacterium]
MKSWSYKPLPPTKDILPFARESKILSRLLWQRGLRTEKEIHTYLNPSLDDLSSPLLMRNMEKAAQRLEQAIEQKEHILIHGDYDVDGMSSVALCYLFLKQHMPSSCLHSYLPHRQEGYGFSEAGLQSATEHSCTLILCLDCGTQDVEPIRRAQEKKIDVLVCDHHIPSPPLSNPYALLNPTHPEDGYPCKILSTAGVAFRLLEAVSELRNYPLEDLHAYLPMVALSICADLVPLKEENRTLTYLGLKGWRTKVLPSLKALANQSKLANPIKPHDLSFKIIPRLNAAGRMDHPKEAFKLLISQEDEDIQQQIRCLEEWNSQRRSLQEKITQEALKQIDSKKNIQVLFSRDWHIGVLGIVASRCVEESRRPCIVLASQPGVGIWVGSARSVNGINIHQELKRCDHLLERFGGHSSAAGLSLREENISLLSAKLNEGSNVGPPDLSYTEGIQIIDLSLELSQISENMYQGIEQLSPFGPENHEPVFSSTHLELVSAPKWYREKHMELQVKDPRSGTRKRAIGFYMDKKNYEHILKKGSTHLHLAYTLERDKFRQQELLLNIKDIALD